MEDLSDVKTYEYNSDAKDAGASNVKGVNVICLSARLWVCFFAFERGIINGNPSRNYRNHSGEP